MLFKTQINNNLLLSDKIFIQYITYFLKKPPKSHTIFICIIIDMQFYLLFVNSEILTPSLLVKNDYLCVILRRNSVKKLLTQAHRHNRILNTYFFTRAHRCKPIL